MHFEVTIVLLKVLNSSVTCQYIPRMSLMSNCARLSVLVTSHMANDSILCAYDDHSPYLASSNGQGSLMHDIQCAKTTVQFLSFSFTICLVHTSF